VRYIERLGEVIGETRLGALNLGNLRISYDPGRNTDLICVCSERNDARISGQGARSDTLLSVETVQDRQLEIQKNEIKSTLLCRLERPDRQQPKR